MPGFACKHTRASPARSLGHTRKTVLVLGPLLPRADVNQKQQPSYIGNPWRRILLNSLRVSKLKTISWWANPYLQKT